MAMTEQLPAPPVLTPTSRPLPPPRFTGSSSGAVIHAVIGLAIVTCLLVEPPGGYTIPVWQGPRAMVAWLPGDPWFIWAGVIGGPSVAVLLGRGAPFTRWALAVLAGCWGAFGGGALAVGIASSQAASVAGCLLLGLAVLAVRDALALGRRRS